MKKLEARADAAYEFSCVILGFSIVLGGLFLMENFATWTGIGS